MCVCVCNIHERLQMEACVCSRMEAEQLLAQMRAPPASALLPSLLFTFLSRPPMLGRQVAPMEAAGPTVRLLPFLPKHDIPR